MESDSLDHMWNAATLDGIWYHLDITWDDSVPDHPGWAQHKYLLRSETAMRQDHLRDDDWITGVEISETGTDYDQYFWQKAASSFCPMEDGWIYMDREGLKEWDGESNSGTLWLASANVDEDTTAGLSWDDGTLYFNNPCDVYTCDPDTKAIQILRVSNEPVKITGSLAENGILTWQTVNNWEYRLRSAPISSLFPEPEPNPEPEPEPITNPAYDSEPGSDPEPEPDPSPEQTPKPQEEPEDSGPPSDPEPNSDSEEPAAEPVVHIIVYPLPKDNRSEDIVPVIPEFTDVPKDAWYSDAVYWTIQNGVAAGNSETTYGSLEICTREEFVVFLWNAAGKPEPAISECTFSDVTEASEAYKAVLWGIETGVIQGTGTGVFSPEQPVTRAQVVTILYRLRRPGISVRYNPFIDIKPNRWYVDAVLWAAETGITNGTSQTSFSPDSSCTKAQAVTFLYRYFG